MSWASSHEGTTWSQSKTGPFSQHGTRLPLVKREYKIGPATCWDPIYGITRFIAVPARSYRCPHCGHLWRADFWSGNVRLGPGMRQCSQCGEDYDDGSREWPQLSVGKKLRFCCPPILAGISGGMVFAAIAVLFLPKPDWRATVAGLVFAVFPLFLFFLVRLPWVFLSIRRYNRQALRFQ